MDRCDLCQSLLLDYLYDLLDAGERQQVQAHLAGCPACQAGLAQARGQQRLMARAARMAFPQVAFAPPEEVPAPPPRPAVLPLRPRAARRWPRYAAAAALLLALGGLGLAARALSVDHADARAAADRGAEAVSDARRAAARADADMFAVRHQCDDALKAIQQVEEEAIHVRVDGPFPGPNGPTYEVATLDRKDRPVPARLDVVQVAPDGALKELASGLPSNGVGQVALPPDADAVGDLEVRAERVAVKAAATVPAAPAYLTLLTTDRPSYRPGLDAVRFRALVLDRFTLRPAAEDFRFVFDVAGPPPLGRDQPDAVPVLRGSSRGLLADPSGPAPGPGGGAGPVPVPTLVTGPDGRPLRGVGAGDFTLDADAPEGEYVLTVREEDGRFPEQRCRFVVRRPVAAGLGVTIDLDKPVYRPGDKVIAIARPGPQRQPLVNRPVQVTLWIDGLAYGPDGREADGPFLARTDARGAVDLSFRLPARIDRGEALLLIAFADGAGPDPAVRPLPIDVGRVEVQFHPEGGALVAGYPNRVVFRVRTPLGRPAELCGRLLEQQVVPWWRPWVGPRPEPRPLPVEVQTTGTEAAAGLGRFTFTPRAGRRYLIEADGPSRQTFDLPPVQADGVALSVAEAVVGAGGPISIKVERGAGRPLAVAVSCRGRLLQVVRLARGQTEVTLQPATTAGGVYHVAVYEEKELPGSAALALAGGADALAAPGLPDGHPVAERLVYRHPAGRVDLAVLPGRPDYAPGERARLAVSATDEAGKALPALLMLAVTELAGPGRAGAAAFPLLTALPRPEDLDGPDLLVAPNVDAAALDLVLAAWSGRPRPEEEEGAERLAVAAAVRHGRSVQRREQQVRLDADVAVARLTAEHNRAREAEAAADQAYDAALSRLAWHARLRDALRSAALPALTAALAVALLVLLVRAARRASVWGWAGAAGVAAAGLLVVLALPAVTPPETPSGAAVAWLAPTRQEHPPQLPLKELQRDQPRDLAKDAGKAEMKPSESEADRGHQAQQGQGAVFPPPQPAMPPLAVGRNGDKPGGDGGKGGESKPKADKAADGKEALAKRANRAAVAEQNAHYLRGTFPQDGAMMYHFEAPDPRRLDEKKTPEQARLGPGLARPVVEWEAAGWQDRLARRAEVEENERRLRFGTDRAAPREEPPVMGLRTFTHQRPTASAEAYQPPAAPLTLYWHPVLVLPGGHADVTFDLRDTPTTYRVTAYAHTLDGRLGASTDVTLTVRPPVPGK
jgi:hypothetical protein